MSERHPASLAYLLIYNPTLPPPPNTSRDDEDAQEEAHVLFYTSRDRVASRDRMLRQVGLAKALVNFSEIFTPGQGCDNVHSQGKRMVSVSPEPDFWMHACVDLSKTPKQTKDKSKSTKSTDPPPPTYYYHEDSVHDLALRDFLLKGYEDFKLLHGTYSSMLKDSVHGTLETHLERFFTPWAWRWDLEEINEFGAHLGLPLHPLNPSLAPLFSSFVEDLPSNTTPLLVSPPYIIDALQHPVAPYPLSLPRYLLSLVPPPGRPPVRRTLSKESSKSTRISPRHGNSNTSASNNTFGFFGAASADMGEAMNVKKWSWPGALTFGKTGSSENKQPQVPDVTSTGSQIKSPGSPPVEASATSLNADNQGDNALTIQDPQTKIEGGVDQSALDDAIFSLNSPSPCETEVAVVTEARVTTENKTLQPAQTPENMHPPLATQQPGSVPTEANVSPLPVSSPQSPVPSFSIFTIFLSDPSKPLVVQRRRVLHISLFRLVFALLMDAEWLVDNEPLEPLAYKVSEFLEKMRGTIDTNSQHDDTGTSTTTNLKNGLNRTRHIISSPQHITSSNTEFSITSSPFFESQESLARDPDTVEVFSRLTAPQHWFVARRGLGSKLDDNIPGEAYLQTTNKEASLVDADNELGGAVRRWARGED